MYELNVTSVRTAIVCTHAELTLYFRSVTEDTFEVLRTERPGSLEGRGHVVLSISLNSDLEVQDLCSCHGLRAKLLCARHAVLSRFFLNLEALIVHLAALRLI